MPASRGPGVTVKEDGTTEASAVKVLNFGTGLDLAVANGVATITAEEGGGGVSDHGALTGLADDDHPQYHNDARGDARYHQLSTDLATQVELDDVESTLEATVATKADDTDVVHKTGNETIAGQKTFDDTAFFPGSLEVAESMSLNASLGQLFPQFWFRDTSGVIVTRLVVDEANGDLFFDVGQHNGTGATFRVRSTSSFTNLFVVDPDGDVTVARTLTLGVDDAYGAGWNGSLEVPTKNAVYDKIETLVAHVDDTTDAHDASAISVADSGGNFTATEVEAALAELATGKVPKATFPVVIGVALSDETTAITTGTAKVTIRAPFAFTLTAVRASLATASSSGTPTVDINESGTTVLSTKLTIDANEKTSTTAATSAVISDSAIADDAEITFDIDTAGTGAKGLKVWLIGTRVIS